MKRLKDESKISIFDMEQEGEAWLNWRSEGVGSSEIALLMSPEPVFDRTVNTMWKQKLGYERTPELDNEHIRRGKELEPKIRDKVNEILGTNFQPMCVLRNDAPYLRASLDGIDFDRDCILEIKAPSPKVFDKYKKTWEIPENYYLQIQYQMLCANVEYCYFAFAQEVVDETLALMTGKPNELEVYIIPVKNNHNLQLDIERRCALFQRGVNDKIPVGWVGGQLSFYETNPTMFIVLGDFETIKPLSKIENFPIEIFPNNIPSNSSEFLNKESFVVGVTQHDYIPTLKESHPHHHIKIINLTESPFSNKVDEVILTKKGLIDHIKQII